MNAVGPQSCGGGGAALQTVPACTESMAPELLFAAAMHLRLVAFGKRQGEFKLRPIIVTNFDVKLMVGIGSQALADLATKAMCSEQG